MMTGENIEVRTIQSIGRTNTSKWQILWLDQNMDKDVQLYQENINELGKANLSIETFTDSDRCVNYIDDRKNEKLILITSGKLGKTTVPCVHGMRQISAIYLFCLNKERHENWAKDYSKIKGVFTCMKPVRQAVNEFVQKGDDPILSIGIISTNNDLLDKPLDQLDPFFVCGYILKEVLLSIDFTKDSMGKFMDYYQNTFVNYPVGLEDITVFQKEYKHHQAIDWYMSSQFFATMINRALCNLDIECIMKMGFFIRDLHKHIVRFYTAQFPKRLNSPRVVMYHGQCLSKRDFHYLKNTQDGLISFLDFLLVYQNPDIASNVARKAIEDPDAIGVSFAITIDSQMSSTPFANIKEIASNSQGANILFSINSIFRIMNMRSIDANDRLWQVDLLTIDNADPRVHLVIKHIEEEAYTHSHGWHRLGDTLIKLQQFGKAIDVFQWLINTEDLVEIANIHRKIGMIKEKQAEYDRAIACYEVSLQLNRKLHPFPHTNVSTCYILLARVYTTKGDYQKAIDHLEAALQIQEDILPPYHPDLANTYRDLGDVYTKCDDYLKALPPLEKVYNIFQEILPDSNPDLVIAAYKIADTHRRRSQYSKALLWLESAVNLGKFSLSAEDATFQKWQTELISLKEKINSK